tara:strand:+ start:550 stop:810 length:261 start_codon:yes stop_codon:yes gene_type:complete
MKGNWLKTYRKELKMSDTQENIILNHLKKHKFITTWEAITQYRITRLSARIFELRERGHQIITNHINENGKRFAEYSLIKESENVR